MAQQVNINDSISIHPTSFDDTHSSYASANTSYPSSNGLTDSSSTTYGQWSITTGSGAETYIYYRFDTSDIPSGATITSITATAKCYINTTNSSRITTRKVQLCTGTTVKGSATTFSNSTNALTLTPGNSWTYNEVQNLGIRMYVKRGTSNTTSAYNVRFYGASVTINYSITGMQYLLTATSEINGTTITPVAATAMGGEAVEFTIVPGSNAPDTDFLVYDNDVNVTADLVEESIGGNGSISAVPGSNVTTGHARSGGAFYQSSSTSSDAWLRYAIGHSAESPYSTSNTSNTYSKDGTNDSTTQGWMIYPFDFSEIPINATITSVQVKCYGAIESTSETACHADVSLWSGSTQKGSTQAFSSTSNSTMTLSNVGTWTREELQDAKLRFGVGYYGGRLLGVTWTVAYTAPTITVYTYTVSNIAADHTLVIEHAGAYEPPEEDPQYTYYSLTVSSLNAITDPTGTTRVIAGTNQTITITPTDPQLTLALDNGVDVTSQLQGGVPNNTYTVTTKVSGATYGFNLNSSTGYYVSSNNGVSKSASVARLNMDFESDCLVTIQYINYAEASYDYGMFGKLDTTVATDGLSAGSNGSSPSDSTSNYQLAMASNSSSAQTITYTVPAGEHFIDIKYGKDDASDDNNDSLQWKVASVEATSAGGDYTYTLTNIQQKHSLIFVFGNVNYYFVTSSATGARIYPDGQMVVLENGSYDITIVPNNITDTITLTDNGNDKTNNLQRIDGYNKNNEPIVNYKYVISTVTAAHNLVITSGSSIKLYLKQNDTWRQYSKVYIKQNGAWVEQTNLSAVFNINANYVYQST